MHNLDFMVTLCVILQRGCADIYLVFTNCYYLFQVQIREGIMRISKFEQLFPRDRHVEMAATKLIRRKTIMYPEL